MSSLSNQQSDEDSDDSEKDITYICSDCINSFESSSLTDVSEESALDALTNGITQTCSCRLIFDMEGAPCAPYKSRYISRLPSCNSENICHTCIENMAGECLPRKFRAFRHGIRPDYFDDITITCHSMINSNMLYCVKLENGTIYVLCSMYTLTPIKYYGGKKWYNIEHNTGTNRLLIDQCPCDTCCDYSKHELSLCDIVCAIFNSLDERDTDYDVIDDNGTDSDADDWTRTMSGGEEDEGWCNAEIC